MLPGEKKKLVDHIIQYLRGVVSSCELAFRHRGKEFKDSAFFVAFMSQSVYNLTIMLEGKKLGERDSGDVLMQVFEYFFGNDAHMLLNMARRRGLDDQEILRGSDAAYAFWGVWDGRIQEGYDSTINHFFIKAREAPGSYLAEVGMSEASDAQKEAMLMLSAIQEEMVSGEPWDAI